MLEWTTEELAVRTNISRGTIHKYILAKTEEEMSISVGLLMRIRSVLESNGMEFSSTNDSVTVKWNKNAVNK
jgi:transcriptional regulator with XRE-family HTH domain